MKKRDDRADYREAFNSAVLLARQLGREVGIEKTPGLLGDNPYIVHHLPKSENRFGFELRCQVVHPDEPLMS